MAKNPNKRRCQVPGCRAWAMHQLESGSANLCHSHLDHQLGPRAAGAPKGNLNAAKSGRYAHPFTPNELKDLAYQVVAEPDSLPRHIADAIGSIQRRSSNPVKTLLLLSRFITQLLPPLAEALFAAELDAFLEALPPAVRPALRADIWKHALPLNPFQRLILIRGIAKNFFKKTIDGKTIDGANPAGS